jgi:hypothetical protein
MLCKQDVEKLDLPWQEDAVASFFASFLAAARHPSWPRFGRPPGIKIVVLSAWGLENVANVSIIAVCVAERPHFFAA